MPKKFKVEVEKDESPYDQKFSKALDLTEREYLGLITTILDYADKVENENRQQD